jgi:hypothetical protein
MEINTSFAPCYLTKKDNTCYGRDDNFTEGRAITRAMTGKSSSTTVPVMDEKTVSIYFLVLIFCATLSGAFSFSDLQA